MSERPTSDPKKPELKDLLLAVRDVVNWHDLGLHLGLPEPILASIATHHDIEGHLRMMLSKWLQFDPEASWEKLTTALGKLGQNAIATSVRTQFMSVTVSTEQENKRSQAMAETVLRKIKSRFALLVIEVQKSMASLKVDTGIVQQFLVNFFEGDCDIPEDAGLSKIFNTVTKARLWRYDHYGPLEELAESFLPEDDPARAQVTEYKSQLTGFQATTRIIDFVKLNELEDREEIPGCMFSPKKYNSHYQKLTVELRLNRDMSELTLEYVNTLWTVLAKEFHLPPLTAVMDKIVEGSLTITWLILPHVIEKIKATYFKLVEFFQQHNIIRIVLYGDDRDGFLLYDEEWMFTGSTPLFRASFAGNIDEVRNLLEGGANVNEANNNARGFTPLIGACMTGQADIAQLLLEHKANVDYLNMKDSGQSPLHEASLCGSAATTLVLLEFRAQVDILDNDEVTPLMLACLMDSTTTARVLLEHGAHVDHQDKEDGGSALMWASVTGHQEIVAVILEYKAQVNLVDKKDESALAYAVELGYADVARFLLENGATMDFEDKVWRELLHHASEQGFSEVVSVLIEYKAPVNTIVNEYDGNTALCVACENGQAETARVLLNHEATLDYQNKWGESSIHLASVGGHTETLKVLIEKQPQLNLQDQDGWTPLLLAIEGGHLETVKLLLEHRAAVDIETKSGLTALKLAQSEGHKDVYDILLQYTQQGSKVTSPEPGEIESRQEEERKEPRESDTDTMVKVQQRQGADEEGQPLSEDAQQKRRESEDRDNNGQQEEANNELTEAQQAEVRSAGERRWQKFKKIFLREVARKEEATQMRRELEQLGTSKYIIAPTKQRSRRSGFLNRLISRVWTPRQGRSSLVGTAPVPEHTY